MSFLFGRKGKGIPANATFRLTQIGQEKLQEFGGDPKSRILMALETRGTSSIDELSQESGLSRGQVERGISSLAQGHFVQLVGAMSQEDE